MRRRLLTLSVCALLLTSNNLGVAEASVHWGPAPTIIYDATFTPGGPWFSAETKDLQSSSGTPDTYMYVLERATPQARWKLLAKDDDGGTGFASKVSYLELSEDCASGCLVRVIVAAYSPYRDGSMDLWVDGNKVADDQPFGGWRANIGGWSKEVTYNGHVVTQADGFRVAGDPGSATMGPISDSMVFVLGNTGTYLDEDDDSGSAYQARVTVTSDCSGDCTVLLAPYPSPGAGGYAMLVHRKGAQPDQDGDGLKADTEADLLSSDTNIDSDGDRIHDYWEVFGTPPSSGSFAGGDDSYELHALGAWPARRTTLIYVDRMAGSDLDPNQQSWLDGTFRNDQAYTNTTIDVILLVSDTQVPFHRYMGALRCDEPKTTPSDWTSVEELKAQYFDTRLQDIAHYLVKVHPENTRGYDHTASGTGDGCQVVKRLGEATMWHATHPEPLIALYSGRHGALTHELGHNYGLNHWENKWEGNAPDHPLSVMNNRYATGGFVGSDGVQRWSYANGTEGPLCQTANPTFCDYLTHGTVGCECNEWAQLQHPFLALQP